MLAPPGTLLTLLEKTLFLNACCIPIAFLIPAIRHSTEISVGKTDENAADGGQGAWF